MVFSEINKEEFKILEDKMKNGNFYQTTSWAELKGQNGWESYYVAVYEKDKPLGICLLLAKKFLDRYLFYAPRGPIVDYNDDKLLDFFLENIKEFILSKKGFVLKIDPYVEYQQHDKEGNIVDELKNDKFIDKLISLKFRHRGFTVGYTDEAQFRWSYALDIKDKKEEDLYIDMNDRCKRCLKISRKYPLIMKDVTDENITDFKGIMEHTARRQKHYDRSIEYYNNLKKYLGNRVKMVIIYLDK